MLVSADEPRGAAPEPPVSIGTPVAPLASTGAQLAVIATASGLAALAAVWVHPLLLGCGLAGGLLVLRRVLLRRSAAAAAYPSWYDAMPCYLSVQDRQLRIIETNDRFRRDFDVSPGAHCYRVYKHRETPCPSCPVLQTFSSGTTHSSEETVLLRDGQAANVVVTSAPLFDQRGKVKAVVEMLTDVTQVKTLRKELQRSRHDFKQLFDIVPCYISIQDRDFRIRQSNALFRQDFGSRHGELCYEAYKGRHGVCQTCPVRQSFEDGQIHSSEEVVVTRDGRQASTVVCSMPIRDEAGRITAVMEVSTNVTEVKRLQSLATVGMAVSGMAHRIKNVLMGLKGGIFVVNTGFEDQDQAAVDKGWQMVERNVDKIGQITRDLLFCSKERQLQREQGISPAAIMREVYELYQLRAKADDIELALALDEKLQPGLFDPEALSKLVANLVANAVDACRFDFDGQHKQHRITMSCARESDGSTVIEVADNGAGIPDELKHKVFDGFFSTKGTEGTGLGLLIVQRVVEEHHGTITFESQAGQGTAFRVVLPPADREQATGSGQRSQPAPALVT